MMLWNFVRMFFLWMPFELYVLCSVVFAVFSLLFIVKVLKTIWDALPGV